MPRSVMLPRVSSASTKRASAKAARRSNDVLKTLSGLPGWGFRASQNWSTNSCQSAPGVSSDQRRFSSAVMIHFTGPSAQCTPACSSEFGGSLNSWKA